MFLFYFHNSVLSSQLSSENYCTFLCNLELVLPNFFVYKFFKKGQRSALKILLKVR